MVILLYSPSFIGIWCHFNFLYKFLPKLRKFIGILDHLPAVGNVLC